MNQDQVFLFEEQAVKAFTGAKDFFQGKWKHRTFTTPEWAVFQESVSAIGDQFFPLRSFLGEMCRPDHEFEAIPVFDIVDGELQKLLSASTQSRQHRVLWFLKILEEAEHFLCFVAARNLLVEALKDKRGLSDVLERFHGLEMDFVAQSGSFAQAVFLVQEIHAQLLEYVDKPK